MKGASGYEAKIVIGGKVKTIKLKKAPVRELFDYC